MCRLTSSSLILPRYLVRCILCTVVARGPEATCAATHISGPPITSKRKGTTSGQEQPGDPPLFGKPPSQSKKMRGGKKSSGKKTVPTSLAGSIDFRGYFEEIGLSIEELIVAAPAPPPQKKIARLEER